jgi:hypothetical protein
VVVSFLFAATACRAPEATPVADAAEAAPPPAALVPAWGDLVRQRPALLVKTTSRVTVSHAGSQVVLADEKRLLRLASGDFDLASRRTHEGSEAGGTDESTRGVRVGRDWYTRGSGGAFVKWDDAREEPDQAAEASWNDTLDVLALAASCAVVRREGDVATFSPADAPCRTERTTTLPPATFEVRQASGEVRFDGGRLALATATLALSVSAGERRADVSIALRTEVSAPPAGSRVEVPPGAIASRRDRPVKMIESVLGGLAESWGPGAPPGLTGAEKR